VVSAWAEADTAEVARLMLSNRIRSIPVVADDRVVGIITRRDLIRVLARSDEDIRIELDDLLEDEIRSIGRYQAHIEGGVVTLTGPTDRESRRLVKVLARSVPGVVTVKFGKAS
jgi:predicted transcriptional regulator